MTVLEFCEQHSLSRAALGRLVGCSRGHMMRIAHGARVVSPDLAAAIARETRAIALSALSAPGSAEYRPPEWVTLDDLPLSPGTRELVDLVREEARSRLDDITRGYHERLDAAERRIDELKQELAQFAA